MVAPGEARASLPRFPVQFGNAPLPGETHRADRQKGRTIVRVTILDRYGIPLPARLASRELRRLRSKHLRLAVATANRAEVRFHAAVAQSCREDASRLEEEASHGR